MRPRVTCSLFLIAALLAGCSTDPIRMRTFNIAGGLAVDLPMTPQGTAAPVENRDVRIEGTGYMLDTENAALIYTFALKALQGVAPRSVTVEDVTGDRAEILVFDPAPELGADSYWRARSLPRRMGDPSIEWVNDLGDTYKVFRFTITMGDGRPFIIHQASVWPGAEKQFAREVLGFAPSHAAGGG